MPPEIKPKTPLANAVYSQMKKRGVSVHQLSEATGVGYERARTVVSGDQPPSQRLLRDICRVLDLDVEETNEMLIIEQTKRKYGRLPVAVTEGDDPTLNPIRENWRLLTPEEKEDIALLVTRYAERRARKRQAFSTLKRMPPRT